jgi:hypothetical protein
MYNIEDSENPEVQKSNRRRHLCEVAMLVLVTLLLSGVIVLRGSLLATWMVLCSAGAALFFFLAMGYSKEAIAAYRSVQFRITPQRLKTLKAVGMQDDVTSYLSQVEGRTYKGEQVFYRMLERELGQARTSEVRATVFKYTKFDS